MTSVLILKGKGERSGRSVKAVLFLGKKIISQGHSLSDKDPDDKWNKNIYCISKYCQTLGIYQKIPDSRHSLSHSEETLTGHLIVLVVLAHLEETFTGQVGIS